MPEVTPIIFQDCSAGVITNVKSEIAPPNSVEMGINLIFDEIYGVAKVRKGSTIIGSQINGSNEVLGLFQYLNSAGTVSKLLSVVAGTIYSFNGSVWVTSSQTGTSNIKHRFLSFLDTVVRINGTDAAVASSNGTTWGSSVALDTANFPLGKFGTVYKDQVIIAGVNSDPDTLYISSVPSSGVISWLTNSRTITINPEDGQNITALGEVNGTLIIWKDRSMYTWNNRSTEADEIVRVGCSSQESVAACGNALAFFNSKGVWLANGGYPILISRPVQKWIDGMSSSYFNEVAAIGDEKYLYVSIGDCTVDSLAYSNIVLRYSVNTKEWAVFSYANKFKVFAEYLDTSYKIVGGDSISKVLTIESSSLSDNGTDIKFDLQSQDQIFGSRGIVKEISERIMGYSKNAQGIVQVKIDDGDWKMIGTIQKEVENMQIKESLKGNKMKFRVVGISKNRAEIKGLEIPNIMALGYSE